MICVLFVAFTVVSVFAFQQQRIEKTKTTRPISQLGAQDKSLSASSKYSDIPFGLTSMSESDRVSALTQRNCPVYDDQLGNMERAHKIMVRGEPVWLCCPGCEEAFLENPDLYLKKIEIFKLGGFASTEEKQPWVNQFLPQAWQLQSYTAITKVEFRIESTSSSHSQDVLDVVGTLPDLEKVILSGRTSTLAPTLGGVFRIDKKALKQKLPSHVKIHMIIG